jgi:ribosomal protein S17
LLFLILKKVRLNRRLKSGNMNKLILVFSFFIGSINCVAQLDSTNCKNFHTGKFSYKEAPYTGTVIKRTAHKQVEINESGRRLVYRIEWVNDCEYNLIFLRVHNGNASHKPGDVVNVKIIESGKFSYVYVAVYKGKEYSQTIWMID